VSVTSIAEDSDDFTLQLRTSLVSLNTLASEDEVHHQRGGYCDEQQKSGTLAGR
jgi:hypothetical protein